MRFFVTSDLWSFVERLAAELSSVGGNMGECERNVIAVVSVISNCNAEFYFYHYSLQVFFLCDEGWVDVCLLS
jgi:hypothetical protein